jgi:hypothetical protein
MIEFYQIATVSLNKKKGGADAPPEAISIRLD